MLFTASSSYSSFISIWARKALRRLTIKSSQSFSSNLAEASFFPFKPSVSEFHIMTSNRSVCFCVQQTITSIVIAKTSKPVFLCLAIELPSLFHRHMFIHSLWFQKRTCLKDMVLSQIHIPCSNPFLHWGCSRRFIVTNMFCNLLTKLTAYPQYFFSSLASINKYLAVSKEDLFVLLATRFCSRV